MSNFEFLKPLDPKLFEIIKQAEKLYSDEYFDQCTVQTRRFCENMCRNVLAERAQPSDSFDEMLATLKDKVSNAQEKEFLDDLYFIKKEGNAAVHGASVKNSAMTALECLKRAFEASINYAVAKGVENESVLALQFDEELLILGRKSRKTSLKEKYVEEKQKALKLKKMKQPLVKRTKHEKNDLFKNEKPKKKNKTSPNKILKEVKETLIAAAIVGVVILFYMFKG